MKVDFELTSDDVAAFSVFFNVRSRTRRRYLTTAGILGFLFVSALPALVLVTTDKPRLETALAIWPLLLGIVLYVLLLTLFSAWAKCSLSRRIRSMIEEGDNSGYFGPCSLSITPDGVVSTSSQGASFRKWNAINRIVMTDRHVFIYVAAMEAFILPRRAFGSDDQCQQFVRQLAEHASVVPEVD